MKKLLKSREGFTLIELLVVIAIIGILAAVVILAINPVELMKKGRDSNRKSDLATLSKAIDIYIVEEQPTDVPGTTGQTSNGGTCCDGDATAAEACTDTSRVDAAFGGWLLADTASCAWDLGSYIAKIPVDPQNTAAYHYTYKNDTTTDKYNIESVLEIDDSTWEVGTNIGL